MTHNIRIFPNVNTLSNLIILSRLRALDTLSDSFTYLQCSDDPLRYEEYVAVQSMLTNEQITNILSTPTSLDEENQLAQYFSAGADFNTLPGWSTWTADEAKTNIEGLIFSGKTQAQVDADIDGLANSFPAMKTGLKQAAIQIIAIRTILVNIAKAIVFIRNLIMRLRR